jgi:hypothetical protein
LFFCFGTAFGAIKFAVATGTTISFSLGRQYRPELSLCFLDVYGHNKKKMNLNKWFWVLPKCLLFEATMGNCGYRSKQ